MSKAGPSRKGRSRAGATGASAKSRGAKGSGSGKATTAKARRREGSAKTGSSGPKVKKGETRGRGAVVVRADDLARIRRPEAVSTPVIPETPPPLPAPIASFTF